MGGFKFDWQPVGAAVFGVVFVGIVVLVALGKLPAEAVTSLMAWLIPSPLHRNEPKPIEPHSSDEVH